MSQMIERESDETFCQMAAGTSFGNLQTNGWFERVVQAPPPHSAQFMPPRITLKEGAGLTGWSWRGIESGETWSGEGIF